MSARVAERRTLDQIAHVLNTVVACGVKFQNVVTVTAVYCPTRIANSTRFSVFGFFAVEHLGQNARSRGFAGATRARKQICLTFTMVNDRILQRTNHVLLTLEFVKATGPVAAI
jgi:hypothetical protein